MVKQINAKDLKPVLIDPKVGLSSKVKPVKNPYYLITDEAQVIFVVSPGLNGVEFNKTIGSKGSFEGITIYQCLYGQGILALQRNDVGGQIKEFKVVTINSGRQVGVPAGWSSCLVNVGKGFLVVLKSGGYEETPANSADIIEKRGLAYYIVEKKGEIGFEQNPNYRVHPQITTE